MILTQTVADMLSMSQLRAWRRQIHQRVSRARGTLLSILVIASERARASVWSIAPEGARSGRVRIELEPRVVALQLRGTRNMCVPMSMTQLAPRMR